MMAAAMLSRILLVASAAATAVPRNLVIKGTNWVDSSGAVVLMTGPNVVVKAAPYLPTVSGTTHCDDTATETCKTFNEADVVHIKSLGYNTIRLGVAWAGAQPTDEGHLDPAFVERLHAILNLTDATGLHVILDNHGDMVGSAGCGNGVPMWVQQAAAPDLIGKPLKTGLPYSLVSSISVEKVGGYDHCGDNATMWAKYAGDPNYNLLNECCQAMNSGNPPGLGYTTISQKTMDWIVEKGAGRDKFVLYTRLLAEVAAQHPSAVAIEPMNEPMTIRRWSYYDTWRAVAEAVHEVVPDMSIALSDVGEGAVLPSWVSVIDAGVGISPSTLAWIKKSNNLFYAWHWYGTPSVPDAVKNVQKIQEKWNVAAMLTETMSCTAINAAALAGHSWSYWHYSQYCDTAEAFGGKMPPEAFGACILGWGSGDSSKQC